MQRYSYETLDSTNLEAHRLWVRTARAMPRGPEPLVVTAAEQTAGMGRAGRSWQSPRGGLWMSVAWPLTQPLAHYLGLPLIVGLATAEAIEWVCGVECQIKWPNDVLVRGLKVAGILCQAEPEIGAPVVIVGIGINGNFAAAALGTGLRHPATTLLDQTGKAADLDVLREAVVTRLGGRLVEFDAGGLKGTIAEIRRRLAWSGRRVSCSDPAGTVLATGTLVGLDDAGRVKIDTGSGVVGLDSGELQLAE